MDDKPYTDPLVIVVGGFAILAVVMAIALIAIWIAVINQIDNTVDYCHSTKTYIAVKDCKASS